MPYIKPAKIRLESCSMCQLKCPSCPRSTESFRSVVGNGFLKFSDFKRLIDENPWIEEVELSSYGEILLNPQLLEIIKYGYERDVALKADNGVNLNNIREDVLEGLVRYRFRSMTCSIDGASDETYKVYRVKGNFETVIENIKKINEFKHQYQSEYPRLVWQVVAFGHNEHEIPLAQKMASELGMDFYVKLTWDDKFSPLRNPDYIRKLVGVASREEYKQKYGIEYLHETCNQLWDEPQINWDGKVLGCCRNFWGDFGGNAFRDGFLKSINNEKINYARDMLLGKEPAREDIPCATCSIYLRMEAAGKWLLRPPLETEKLKYGNDIGKLQVITPKKRDFKMLVTSRYVPQYRDGSYEDFTSDLLLSFAKDDMLFIDIGAHYGYYTLLVGTKYPDCRIIAFEPVPENFEILKQNVVLNQLKNTELHNVAVSDSDRLREFKVMELSSRSSFYDRLHEKTQKEIEVQTICLDNLLKKTPKASTIIKIDAEGHEPYILHGMKKLLKDSEDIKLIIEFNPRCLRNAGCEAEDFLEEVSQLGFDIYVIDDNKRMTYKLTQDSFEKWRDYLPEGDENRVTNLLCIKKQESLSACFFSHSAQLDGAERSLLELTTELVKDHGVVCSVILPNDGPLKERLEEVGVSTHVAGYSWWWDPKILPEEQVNALCTNSSRSLLHNIKQVIAKINPDVIVTNTMVIPWGAITASFLGKPHVWFVREFGEKDHSLKPFLPIDTTLNVIKKLSALIVTNSDAVRKALFPNMSSKKVLTVYPYVNIPSTALHQDEGNYFARANSTRLIMSASVHEGKGQKDAILAVRELVPRGRDVELIIMGDCSTDYAEHLKTIAREEKLGEHVKFIDFKENPYLIMNQADIVLVCSRNEAFGRVTVEGMLLKKPVIGTSTGGTLELIKDGLNGLLYEPGNYEQLADKVEYLIEHKDEANELAENGYKFAKKTFTRSKFGGKVYKLLRNLKHKATSQVSYFNTTLKGPDILEAMLSAAADKDPKVATLITELGSSLTTKDAQISSLEASLEEKVSQISSLEASLEEKVSQISSLEAQIQQIHRGIVVQLLSRYQRVIEKLLRPGTRRRYYYELGLAGIRVILNEGWHSFWRKAKLWLRVKKVKYAAASDRSVYLTELPLNHGQQVDIVVPVYNAFDWTRRCLSAVLSFTVGIPYRLIVVDDGSTDQRLLEYLAYLESRNSNVIVLRNRKNVGFLESVNRGMSFSNNDVVLLNTDAIVTYDWLSKLRACAYSDDRIATVTPISNNATVCSVPEFCKNNQIPPGYSVQEFGELVEKASQRIGISFYELPVGIGFCMYVKRKVISEIGLYSEEFGRGYEEEVDFCLRASEKGYCHVACPHVFVYHAGTASTNTEQAQLLEAKNWNILVKKHPYYPQMVTDFTARNPLSDIQIAIRKSIEVRPIESLRVGIDAQLLVRNRWTGSERYMMRLIDGLVSLDSQNRYTIFTADGSLDRYYRQNGKFTRKYALDSTDILWDSDFFATDVFHRPFQCYSAFDLLLLLNAKASVITILDLISYHHPDYFLSAQDYKRYQKIMGLAAKIADRIIAISEHSKRDMVKNLQVPPEKITVVYPALLDTSKFKKTEDPSLLADFKAKYKLDNPYILYIGTTFPHKNHEGLISAYECLLNSFGGDRASVPDLILIAPDTHLNRRRIIESKLAKIKDKVQLLDYVPDEDMPLFYSCASLFVFPSLYEGFGLPLLEAMACEVPVVASDATSIPEVVGDAAVLVDCTQPKQLADAMYSVLNDAGIRSELVERGKKRIKLFSTVEMIEKTLEVYKEAYQATLGGRPKLPDDVAMEIRELAKEDGAGIFLTDG